MRTEVLIIDDDDRMQRTLRRILSFAGYNVRVARTGQEGLTLTAQRQSDLIILDVMLPGMDGLDVCRQLRAVSAHPVLMLTALGTADDCVRGLDAGADDYLTKPFSIEELLARARALLRRTQAFPNVLADPPPDLTYVDLTLHSSTHQVSRGSHHFGVGAMEFRLLWMFLQHPEHVLTRVQLSSALWGGEHDHSSDVLAAHVYALRQKLEQSGMPRLIHTVRGVGYVLRR